jgi:hypothetical protein
MPLDPATATAGIQAIGNTIDAGLSMITNKAQRKWNEKMYQRQRADALSDWQKQADYNSPKAQMERLKAAGLNPNMVYGKGADAQMSTPIRSTDVKSWNPKSPEFNAGSVLGAYYETQMKQAQTDNLKIQSTLLEAEKRLKAAQTLSTLADADSKTFDAQMKKDLKEIFYETKRQELKNLETDIQKKETDIIYTLDKNEREILMNNSSLQKMMEETLLLREQRANTKEQRQEIREKIELLRKDNTLRQLDINLREKGANWNDNIILRSIYQWMDSPIDSARKTINNLWENIKNLF